MFTNFFIIHGEQIYFSCKMGKTDNYHMFLIVETKFVHTRYTNIVLSSFSTFRGILFRILAAFVNSPPRAIKPPHPTKSNVQ